MRSSVFDDGSSRAARELERRDPGAPVPRTVGLQVLARVPEGAVVHRVDGHGAVVTPAVQRPGLRSTTGLDDALRLHRSERVGEEPARVADAREDGPARNDADGEHHPGRWWIAD